MNDTHYSNALEDWKDAVLQLEQMVADGRTPDFGLIERLPPEVLLSSPVLLRAAAIRLSLNGQLEEARHLISAAVKGFALQADDTEMLSMMGLLTLLYVRIGDFSETETLLVFLAEEYRRTPARCSGFVLWSLARGLCWTRNEILLHPFSADECFDQAALRFREAGDATRFALLLLDRWLYDPNTFDTPRWTSWFNHLSQWSAVNPECQTVWQIISGTAGKAVTAVPLPYRYEYLIKTLTGALCPEPPDKGLKYDVEVQLYIGYARINRKLAKGELADAAAALRQYELLLEEMKTPVAVKWLTEMKASPGLWKEVAGLAPFPSFSEMDRLPLPEAAFKKNGEAHTQLAEAYRTAKRRAQLMGGIRFVQADGTVIEPKWKRKKSKELLVYLLLQPEYRTLRDQVVEHVFGEGDATKLANHLYVSLHELRSTLAGIGLENAIVVRGGLIGFREDLIKVVDVEQFIALSRVGDQLWADDREAAAMLYMDAIRLYGLLGAEMPYIDWVERWRGLLLERQTQMLRRMAEFYAGQENESHTEQWLAAWIELRPDQEEAYQAMIRFWKERGRIAESISWYRRLERICREDLGTEPLEETKSLIWEGSSGRDETGF
jgi:DNA-binding SARP family transcriptional activator